ncbi:unnamed protein product [Phytophthora lilii]|uniref:Unnamed protein product n=1 Tax=Phytophthora lilii TaxID=2077276 RepID=A0A9W7CNJ1_9STRA|nr:unnamed protein product [Phytophthora lilii]
MQHPHTAATSLSNTACRQRDSLTGFILKATLFSKRSSPPAGCPCANILQAPGEIRVSDGPDWPRGPKPANLHHIPPGFCRTRKFILHFSLRPKMVMTSVVCEATIFAVDQGLAGGALIGSGVLLTSLVKLVEEMHGSKEMCQDLIVEVQSLVPQLETMLKNDNITTSKDVLTRYETLLREVQVFLQNHRDSKLWERVTKHWKMKKFVQQFYVDLAKIKNLLVLKQHEEAANWHGGIREMFDRYQRIDKQAQTALSNDLHELMTQIEKHKFIDGIGQDKYVAVADLKKEWKDHHDMYTTPQLKQIKCILQKAIKLVPGSDSHLERWYLSCSDFRFDERSPFATGTFRSLYYGTLVSGAEVTIKIVQVDMGDNETRSKFAKEAQKWYNLRDPHVLPLYGANHINSPMVFVCGRAENGNFNEYLLTHRQKFWQVFLDAARGLAYLHKHHIVHGNLKCSNLLVTKNGVGVLSDFVFAFVRANSALSLKEQAPDYFWKAPECFSENPRFESDVYSLGMCIFEAMSGVKPFADVEEEDAINKIKKGELPHRGGNITDEAWNLITEMCTRRFQDRISLEYCIARLQLLAEREQEMSSQRPCECTTHCCLECGGRRHFTTEDTPSKPVSETAPVLAAVLIALKGLSKKIEDSIQTDGHTYSASG